MFHKRNYLWVTYCVSVTMLLANIAASNSVTRTYIDDESLGTQLELDEYDFEDLCTSQLVPADWGNSLANRNLRIEVSESLARSQGAKAIDDYSGHTAAEYSMRAAKITRKLELISKPGDVVLRQEDYQQLLAFPGKVNAVMDIFLNDCEKSLDGMNMTLNISATSNHSTCESNKTESLRQEYSNLLELVPKAAKLNGFEDVESYWLLLSELPTDGYQRAKTLWAEVKPLYQKLNRWVSESIDKKCRSKSDAEMSNPACESSRIIGWPLTHDWTSLADLVLPKECRAVFQKIQTNLEANKITAKKIFEMAEKMTNMLKIGNLPPTFWKDSLFNQSCPSRYLDTCQGDFRVAACSKASWSDYLDAHEISIRAISSELTHSNTALSYLLKNGNRFSALNDGVVGLGSVIAANRHHLSQQGIGISKNIPCVEDTLATLLALRILPKLTFYLLADLARIEVFNSNGTTDIVSAWRSLWNEDDMMPLVEDIDWGQFLGEERFAANQPYISQFYGLFIQFQLFEKLLKSDASVSDDAEEFIRSSQQLRELLELGKSKKWPLLLFDSFQISNITSAPLVRFFNRFDTFISPFVVPKETKKTHNMLIPDPDMKNATEEAHITKKISTEKTTSSTTLSYISEDGLGLNETQVVRDSSEEPGDGRDYIIGAVIACIVVGAFAIAIIVYRRHLSKTRQYQRPANQPA